MNRVSHYMNIYGQWCTDVWIDGKYSRIPDRLSLNEAMARVKDSRKNFDFKD